MARKSDALDNRLVALTLRELSDHVKQFGADALPEEFVKSTLRLARALLDSSDGPTVADIAAAVAAQCGIPLDRLRARQRTPRVVVPRQIAIYLACEATDLSTTTIGAWFGLDHSTVVHSRQTIRARAARCPIFARRMREMLGQIGRSQSAA